MKILCHKRAFFAVFFAIFLVNNSLIAQQTTLLSETFNTCSLPTGWTANTPQHWAVAASQGSFSLDNTCMVTMQDAPSGSALSLQFTSPSFNAKLDSTVTFSVDLHLRTPNVSTGSTSGAALKVFVWDGAKYVSLAYYRYSDFQNTDRITLVSDLTFYRNTAMRIKIQFEEGSTRGASASFDNVKVIGTKTETNLLLENFDACAKPAGWVTQILKGVNDWTFGLSLNGSYKNYAASLNGTCFALFDDDIIGANAAPSKLRLTSPTFDGTRFANVFLDFDMNFKKYAALENVTIYITDGIREEIVETILTEKSADQQLFKYSHLRYDISLLKSTQMRIIFEYDDAADFNWWVGIDNVKVSGKGTLNDFCSNAVQLTEGAACLNGDNSTAVFQGTQPACSPQNIGSLWYKFTPTVGGKYAVKTNSNFNDAISVYTGTCAGLTDLVCHNKDEHGFVGEELNFQATAGTLYFLRVSGQDKDFGKSRGKVCMEVKAMPPPPPPNNDLCANALALTINQTCSSSNSNVNATYSTPLPTKNLRSRSDIWYKLTTTSTKDLEITTNSDFSEVITAYKGTCGSLTEYASNDYGRTLSLTGNAIGTTYYIQISGYFTSIEGSICASVKEKISTTISNEICASATPLIMGGNCNSVSNRNATMSTVKPSCSIFNDADLWFKFTAPASGSVKVNTGADFVHTLAIYQGTCTLPTGGLSGLTELMCRNNPLRCEGWVVLGGLTPNSNYFLQISSQKAPFGFEYGNVCIKIDDASINDNIKPLKLVASVTCTTPGQGQLNLEASGGVGAYTFVGNQNGSVVASGARYTAVVKDQNGCEQAISDTCACGIFQCTLSANANATAATCFSNNDGKATAIASNANGGATYKWSNGGTSAVLTGLAPGSYSVTITDATGCVSSSSVIVQQPTELLAQSTGTAETYFQANDGKVFAYPTGGTQPYTYLWSNGSTSQNITGLAPAIYKVTVTDAKGCTGKESVEVKPFNCTLSVTATASNVNCNGNSNGSAIANVLSGYTPYTFAWSNGSFGSNNIQNLSAASYTVTVTDNKNCPSVQTVVVGQPNPLTVAPSATGETSFGANNGTAGAIPSGGVAPYNYLWSNGGVTQTLTNLAPGNYQVSVIDANNCLTSSSVSVNNFICSVHAVANVGDATCFGLSNGTASATMPDGTPPFQYAWSNGATQSSLQNLPAGTYSATVTDNKNCIVTASVAVGQPESLSAAVANVANVPCIAETTGAATVSAVGGTSPYQYLWQNGSTAANISNLGAGTFFVTVVDAKQCQTIAQAIISVADNSAPTVLTKNIDLLLDDDGNASLTAAQINNGSSDNCGIANVAIDKNNFDCSNVGQNTVLLSVVDVNGNAANASAIVNVIDNIAPTFNCPANIISNSCDRIIFYTTPLANDNCSSFIVASQTSGLASGSKFPIGMTPMSFRAIDASGNQNVCQFTVTQNDTLHADIFVEKPTCFGQNNGFVVATPVGGSPNYQYAWSNGKTTSSINNLASGIYEVTITDELGCNYSQQILVTEPQALGLVVDSVADQTSARLGTIAITPNGGTPPYAFTWTLNGSTFQSNSEDLSDLEGGTYHVQIADANGCNIISQNIIVKKLTANQDVATDEMRIRLQPNPTDAKTTLWIDAGNNAELRLTLYDAATRELWAQPKTVKAADSRLPYELDLSSLAAGVYWLKIEMEQRASWRKIVVVR